jgi:azurin
MKMLNILAALSLVLFIGCGGGGSESTEQAGSSEQATSGEARTIEIIGVDQMKFAVEANSDGISVGSEVGSDGLLQLETITAKPGEKLHVKLTTQSQLPKTAMAHNWLLLALNADTKAFATAAMKAKDNDYIPSDMQDQIITQTGLAGGGETHEVTFTVPEETGDYDYICTFPGHFVGGMKGKLVVEE